MAEARAASAQALDRQTQTETDRWRRDHKAICDRMTSVRRIRRRLRILSDIATRAHIMSHWYRWDGRWNHRLYDFLNHWEHRPQLATTHRRRCSCCNPVHRTPTRLF